jgi:hypothetical protein
MNALLLAGKGMLGIFVVMILISLLVLLLSKATSPRQENTQEQK